MTFNDNQMLILSFEALNATIAEFRDARDQLGCVIGGTRANFRCIARQQGFSTNDINSALPYVSNYIVSNISMIMEAVASK